MRELTCSEAKLESLRQIFAAKDKVHLMARGLRSYREIQQQYPDRVSSMPISELGACGLAIGAAMAGLRPIVDVGNGSFVFEAWSQIVNEAANALYMSGGQTRTPVVFHMSNGLRGGGASQHSHSPQAMLWNTPGLEIVLPASPRNVGGLLKSAVNSANPTVFIDHRALSSIRGHVPEENGAIPFVQADVQRVGKDVTVIATSYMVKRSLQMAEGLAREGIDVEVVDPRTLVPLDFKIMMASVEKTGLVVIVDECHQSCGVAAELSARIVETGFDKLKAGIRRINTLDVLVPYSEPLEEYISPSESRITEAIRSVLDL